jgi:CBS domain containing-hemolysin-like protein
MNNLVISLIFLALALFGVILKKTYFALPLSELKRRAGKNDQTAAVLFKAAAYGDSLRIALWIYISLTAAVSLILMAKLVPLWLSLIIIAILLWVIFSLVPTASVSSFGISLTRLATPFLAWLLNYLHPLFSRGALEVEKNRLKRLHTGIFERDDLLELIDRQQYHEDNRLSAEELEIVRRALQFKDQKVSTYLIPRKKVKTVLATDTIGPILINELHESNQDYVLVKESSKGRVVGTLAFRDLGIASRGQAKDHMDSTLYYLHEQDNLSEALHAFFVTNHSMFTVVNSSEEFSGIITIEAVLRQLLGHVPGEVFEDYTDISAVAARHINNKQFKKVETNDDQKELA